MEAGVEIVNLGGEENDEGVVERTGARGRLRSIYERDVDKILIK